MNEDKIVKIFSETTRHYLGNSFLIMIWAVTAVILAHIGITKFLFAEVTILVIWFIITYRWIKKFFPTQHKAVNIYFFSGLLKYGFLAFCLTDFILSKMYGVFSLNLMIILLVYIYDAMTLSKILAYISAEEKINV